MNDLWKNSLFFVLGFASAVLMIANAMETTPGRICIEAEAKGYKLEQCRKVNLNE